MLKQLLSTGECDFDGEHYQVHGLRLRPQLDRDLSENLWCAGGSPESVSVIARNDVKPLIIPTTSLDLSLEVAKAYIAACAHEAGHGTAAPTPSSRCGPTSPRPRPRREPAPSSTCVEYSDSALRHYELLGDHLKDLKGYETYGADAGGC